MLLTLDKYIENYKLQISDYAKTTFHQQWLEKQLQNIYLSVLNVTHGSICKQLQKYIIYHTKYSNSAITSHTQTHKLITFNQNKCDKLLEMTHTETNIATTHSNIHTIHM